jgi:thiol-disulfide isomerase/thioredoxin
MVATRPPKLEDQVEVLDGSTFGHLIAPGLGIASSTAAGLWFGRRRGVNVLPLLAKIVASALLAARVAFVLQHYDSYRGAPWSLLDITDGGFTATAGLFAALVIGTELTRKLPGARRPITFAIVTGIAFWMMATVAVLDFAPARVMVPLMEAKRLDGTPVQLRTFTRKPMVVNLWATWCPPCRREMPVLSAAQRQYPDITFVFLNQGESTKAILSFLDREGLHPDNVFADPFGSFFERIDGYAYPTTLFFDSEGVLFMRQVGELNGASLEERLAMLRKAEDKQGARGPM